MDTWVTAILAGLAGLVAGSWVIAQIAWLPGREPGLSLPPTRCPGCEARLHAADLVPYLGWRRMAERCPEVAATWWLPAGLATAVAFIVMAARFGPSPVLPAYCYLAAIGVALAFVDVRHHRLPDSLTLPSYPVALALLGIAALTTHNGAHHFLIALAGLGAASLLFLLQALIYPAGIGLGDVKLSGLLGLYLGWLGVRALVAGLFLGYLLAAVVGVALLATRKATRKSQVPFGPFLVAATLITILASGPGAPF
jgi:leader peptidase (prepilin peptidase) / N-methyltransferase